MTQAMQHHKNFHQKTVREMYLLVTCDGSLNSYSK